MSPSTFLAAWKTKGLPQPSTPAVLLPFAFIAALGLALPACNTPGGQALKQCELGSLPQTLESVVAEVLAIALNTASVVTDLEGLAGKVGPSQLSCVAQAVEAWLSGKSAATSSRLMAGVGESQRQHALELLHLYVTAHPPTACRNVKLSDADIDRSISRYVAWRAHNGTYAASVFLLDMM